MDASNVRAALLDMAETDQAVRGEIAAHTDGDGTVEPGFLQNWHDIDHAHTAKLCEIVAEHGWPGHTLAGVDGAAAAWLLAQHADLTTQQRLRPLLAAAVDAGDATPVQLAYLDDRIALYEGRPQRYGTQMTRRGGGPVTLWDVEEPETLDERRGALGLGTVAEQLAAFNLPQP